MYCHKKRSTKVLFKQIFPSNANQHKTSPSPVQLQRSDTTETKNEDLNNDALEHQSVLISLSNDNANPDNIISLELVCDEPFESDTIDAESPKERLKSSLSNLSTLYDKSRPQSATSSVLITDDTNVTSPSLTTMTTYKSDFNSDTSNDTTRSSSATTASSTDGEVCIVYIVHCLQYSIIERTTSKVKK